MLSNPFWFALRTEHARFALGNGQALRYPADVIPFAGVEYASAEQWAALCELLREDEKLFVIADHFPQVDGLRQIGELPGLQLHFSGDAKSLEVPEYRDALVQTLGEQNAPAMISLTEIAFPGLFRERTYELGAYFGILKTEIWWQWLVSESRCLGCERLARSVPIRNTQGMGTQ